MSEESTSLQPTKSFSFAVKNGCETCDVNIEKLRKIMKDRPYKYGNKIVITLHQEWRGDLIWHIDKVETGNYERDLLEGWLEKARESDSALAIHGVEKALKALEWID